MNRRIVVISSSAALAAAGCGQLLGLGEFQASGATGTSSTGGGGDTSASSTSTSTSGASTGTTGSGGGATTTSTSGSGGSCPGTMIACAGACTDVSMDKANCGGCGHSCQGGECAASVCAPVTLAMGLDSPRAIAIDATSVYWGAGNGVGQYCVSKVQIVGSKAVAFECLSGVVSDLVVTGGSAYWSDITNSAIRTEPVDKLFVSTDFVAAMNTTELAALGGKLYWIGQGGLFESPLVNPVPNNKVTPAAFATGIAVDATNIYWTSGNNGNVMSAPLAGGNGATLAFGQDYPVALAVDATDVYWINAGDVAMPTTKGSVRKVPIAGGNTVTLASGLTPTVNAGIAKIVIDAKYAYWTNSVEGTVTKVPLGGGAAVVLASGQQHPAGIAVDANSVYWTNQGDPNQMSSGSVMLLAK